MLVGGVIYGYDQIPLHSQYPFVGARVLVQHPARLGRAGASLAVLASPRCLLYHTSLLQLVLDPGVAALAPVALVPSVEMLDVPARMSSTVALHPRHYLIHWRPPVRDLLQVFVDQPLQTLVLVAVNIAPKGPLAYPEQPGLLLSQAACL